MRKGEPFLREHGQVLASGGYIPDRSRLERAGGSIVLYHYTRQDHLENIMSSEGGLNARLPVVLTTSGCRPEFDGCHELGAFLEPFPVWLTTSPYFGDLGYELLERYVGDLLLRIQVPADFPGLYIADYAHVLECKYHVRRGSAVLGLGYDCITGHEATQAYVNSYVVATNYNGGHVAPMVHVVRRGQGIAVPSRYIRVAEVQPFREDIEGATGSSR